MAIAAVPHYLGEDFSLASPGLRFGMYLKLWGINSQSGKRLWTTHDLNYRPAGHDKTIRQFRDENKTSALHDALKLSAQDQAVMAALATRQAELAKVLRSSGALLRLETESIAPFSTGLGNEHPLENGFAFLNPYGLPYLPGSGVKGVLRQAAHELARGEWGDSKGWSEEILFTLKIDKKIIPLSPIDVLFGRKGEDGDTDPVRGALTFWDVFPRIKGNSLHVEVMTPHQRHYYQKGEHPHESGSPNPINFLTVPPGSDFAFHVQCDRPFLARLAPNLARQDQWKTLMEVAFAHAFTWLGFGAKTAVGYGAMKSPTNGPASVASAGGSGAASGPTNQQEEWTGVEIRYNPGNGELMVTHQGKSASLRNPNAQRLRERLPEDLRERLKKQKALKNCDIQVERLGNVWRLVAIRAVGGVALAEVWP